MVAETLSATGIGYEKIDRNNADYEIIKLGNTEYYKEKKPIGQGRSGRVYTVYPIENNEINRNKPFVIKEYIRPRGVKGATIARQAWQDAKVLGTQFKAEAFQLAGDTYQLLGENSSLTEQPALILMPKFPGEPIVSPTGKPHPKLALLTPAQRFALATLVIKTLMELKANFTDLRPDNILIDIQFDKDSIVSFKCYLLDFAGCGRTTITAAPEWNGIYYDNSDCDLFLVPTLTDFEENVSGNAIILDNNNHATLVVGGKRDKKLVIALENRQGLPSCDALSQVPQSPRTSKVIAEATQKSGYGLGNHDKKMEVYSALSVIAPILGETTLYEYKKKAKDSRQQPFCLENMTLFLREINTADPSVREAIDQANATLHAMQNSDPEQRPSYREIYATLNKTSILLAPESSLDHASSLCNHQNTGNSQNASNDQNTNGNQNASSDPNTGGRQNASNQQNAKKGFLSAWRDRIWGAVKTIFDVLNPIRFLFGSSKPHQESAPMNAKDQGIKAEILGQPSQHQVIEGTEEKQKQLEEQLIEQAEKELAAHIENTQNVPKASESRDLISKQPKQSLNRYRFVNSDPCTLQSAPTNAGSYGCGQKEARTSRGISCKV